MGEGTVLVLIQSFVEFRQRSCQIALLYQALSTLNGSTDLDLRRVRQHTVFWIHHNPPRSAERFQCECRVCADNFDSLFFRLAVGVNTQSHRHAEEIKVLRNLPDDTESF